MYENSIKSSSHELLGKPGLHDPLCKLFFEQFFDDLMSLTIFVLYVYNLKWNFVFELKLIETENSCGNWSILNHHNAFNLNVSLTLVLPKQRNKSTKFTLPFYHSNIGKSCYLRYQCIKALDTGISENLKTLASYPPGIKTSWRRCSDVSLYVPVTSQVRLKWNTQRRLDGTLSRRLSGASLRLIGTS